ncbi:uncharacterized protein LOC143299140 [Babylonia areolata]|uniref:uncharacterized protein LOC143299140 n=1 Tax=Babylonia areolata TaxID=304850 RepID=UPI003FD5F217
MASGEVVVVMRKRRQPSEDLDDTPESTSVDDIPVNEYSDDNIDDIVEANMAIDSSRQLAFPGHRSGRGSKAASHVHPEDAVRQFADGVSEEDAQALIAARTLTLLRDRGCQHG